MEEREEASSPASDHDLETMQEVSSQVSDVDVMPLHLKKDGDISSHVSDVDVMPLLKKEVQNICQRFKKHGIESLFVGLDVKVKKKFCLGSKTGTDFLCQRLDLVEDFHKFCTVGYDDSQPENFHGRSWKQPAFCKFCGEKMLMGSLRRHMHRKHGEEVDVNIIDWSVLSDEDGWNSKVETPVSKVDNSVTKNENSALKRDNSDAKKNNSVTKITKGDKSSYTTQKKIVETISKGNNSLHTQIETETSVHNEKTGDRDTGKTIINNENVKQVTSIRSVSTRSMGRRMFVKYTCDVCQDKFSSLEILSEHLLTDHDQNKEDQGKTDDTVTERAAGNDDEMVGVDVDNTGSNRMEFDENVEGDGVAEMVDRGEGEINQCKEKAAKTDIPGLKNSKVKSVDDEDYEPETADIIGQKVTKQIYVHCEVCNLRLNRKSLSRHMERRHGEAQYQSPKPKKPGGDQTKKLDTPGAKNSDNASKVSKDDDKSEPETPETEDTIGEKSSNQNFVYCEVCNLKLKRISLKGHMRRHREAESQSPKPIKPRGICWRKTTATCKFCGDEMLMASLKRHVRRLHSDELGEDFDWSKIYNEKFDDNLDSVENKKSDFSGVELEDERKSHPDVKKKSKTGTFYDQNLTNKVGSVCCEICHFKLNWTSLRHHMERMHGSRSMNITSEFAPKAVFQKSMVMSLSVGDNIYCCHICGLRYANIDNMASHLMEKHKIMVTSDNNEGEVIQQAENEQNGQVDEGRGDTEEQNVQQELEKDKGVTDKQSGKIMDGNRDLSKETVSCAVCEIDFAVSEIDGHLLLVHGIMGNANSNDDEKNSTDMADQVNSTGSNSNKQNTVNLNSSDLIKCDICGKLLKDFQLKYHMKKHQDVKLKYKCPDCNKRFGTRIRMLGHQRSMHKRMNLFNCDKCSQNFHTAVSLNKHQSKCDGSTPQISDIKKHKPFSCPECLRRFRSDRALKEHIIKHSQGWWTCKECGLICASSNVLLRHRMRHRSKKMFKCVICGIPKHATVYSLHLKNFHKSDQYHVCVFCGSLFSDNAELKNHAKTCHMNSGPVIGDQKLGAIYSCDVCNAPYGSANELRTHSKTHKSSFVCEVCGKMYKKKSLLDNHRVSHSQERPIKCELCDFKAKSKSRLKSHMKVHNTTFTHQCDECGKCFKRVECLKSHVLTHKEDFKFKCKHCPEQFRAYGGLKEHILRAHSDAIDLKNYKLKYFRCEYCDLIFGGRESYRRHVRQHTGYKPFTCDICGASFPVQGTLNRHKNLVHLNLIEIIPCKLCNGSFKGKSKYRRHLRSQKHRDNLNKVGITNEDFEKMFPVAGKRKPHLKEEKVEIDYAVSDLKEEKLEIDYEVANLKEEKVEIEYVVSDSDNSNCIFIQVPQGTTSVTLPVQLEPHDNLYKENMDAVAMVTELMADN